MAQVIKRKVDGVEYTFTPGEQGSFLAKSKPVSPTDQAARVGLARIIGGYKPALTNMDAADAMQQALDRRKKAVVIGSPRG